MRVYPGHLRRLPEARARGLPLSRRRTQRSHRRGLPAQRARRAARPTGPRPLPCGGARRRRGGGAGGGGAHVWRARRHGLGSRLARLQGQTLDGLMELAEEHARAQEELEASDKRLLAAIRRGLG